jgi:hypothetical protein
LFLSPSPGLAIHESTVFRQSFRQTLLEGFREIPPLRFRCGHGSHAYLPGVRLREGRDDADERLSARLRLRGLPVASTAALRRLLRVLLLCRSGLSAEADRRRLRLAEALTLGVKAGLLVGRDRGVKAPRDVPAKGAAQGAAPADALGRAAATPTRRVVEPFDYRHGGSLRRRRLRFEADQPRRRLVSPPVLHAVVDKRRRDPSENVAHSTFPLFGLGQPAYRGPVSRDLRSLRARRAPSRRRR